MPPKAISISPRLPEPSLLAAQPIDPLTGTLFPADGVNEGVMFSALRRAGDHYRTYGVSLLNRLAAGERADAIARAHNTASSLQGSLTLVGERTQALARWYATRPRQTTATANPQWGQAYMHRLERLMGLSLSLSTLLLPENIERQREFADATRRLPATASPLTRAVAETCLLTELISRSFLDSRQRRNFIIQCVLPEVLPAGLPPLSKDAIGDLKFILEELLAQSVRRSSSKIHVLLSAAPAELSISFTGARLQHELNYYAARSPQAREPGAIGLANAMVDAKDNGWKLQYEADATVNRFRLLF